MKNNDKNSNSSDEEIDENLFKVIVIGDIGTGKTSIIKRHVHNIFTSHYKSTIGVDFALKVISRPGCINRIQLWDIAGQERFGNMTRVYYKEAAGAIVVFDITRGSTFESVERWYNDVRNKVKLPDGRDIPVVIFANKCDLIASRDYDMNLDKYCEEKGILKWFNTSAKDSVGIDDGMNYLLDAMIRCSGKETKTDTPGNATASFNLDDTKTLRLNPGCCS